jgi:hypothetical protein
VGPGHDDPVVASRRCLGDEVRRGDVELDERLRLEVNHDLPVVEQGGQVVPDLERGTDDRDGVGEGVPEGRVQGVVAVGFARRALVEDDDAHGARVVGVRRLDGEVAGAALDEGDVAGDEVVEVLRLAAAARGTGLVARRQHEVHSLQRRRDVPAAGVLRGVEVLSLHIGHVVGGHLLEDGIGELSEAVEEEGLAGHLVPGALEEVLDVGQRLGVAVRPAGARAGVVVRDLLELGQVVHDGV